MQKRIEKGRVGRLAGVLVCWFLAAGGFAQAAQDAPPNSGSSQAPAPASPSASDVGDWWLGVQCRPVDEALGAQLGLAEAQGLIAEKIVPESPAAKAGLRRHDILVTAGGKTLKAAPDLIAAVNAVDGKDLVVEYLRNGRKDKVTLQPQRRPEWARSARMAQESQLLRKWLQQFQSADPGSPLRFRFIHPGAILPGDAPSYPPLPENVSITITKRGSEPAKVVVTRDEKKWEAAENELDKLPKDLAPYAKGMLGRSFLDSHGVIQSYEFVPDWVGSASAGTKEGSPPDTAEEEANGPVQRRLEKMNRQLDELRRSVDELRKERSR